MKTIVVQPGELLHFAPERKTMLVVMANENGFRYIEPMNPQFDDEGNVISTFVAYEALEEWTISLGTVASLLHLYMGLESK